jgi:hypothetical protein
MSDAKSPDWKREIRCPRLGGPVTFEYCLVENQGQPCGRALTCWSFYFDVEAYFHSRMSPEQFEACFNAQIKPKVVTLIELIEKARKNMEGKRAEEDRS